jgi:hypothetical protein
VKRLLYDAPSYIRTVATAMNCRCSWADPSGRSKRPWQYGPQRLRDPVKQRVLKMATASIIFLQAPRVSQLRRLSSGWQKRGYIEWANKKVGYEAGS